MGATPPGPPSWTPGLRLSPGPEARCLGGVSTGGPGGPPGRLFSTSPAHGSLKLAIGISQRHPTPGEEMDG